jgi:hypothetical protein
LQIVLPELLPSQSDLRQLWFGNVEIIIQLHENRSVKAARVEHDFLIRLDKWVGQ